MSLHAPNLDNRRFQDIVDEAKRLIPRYCPEWTDHNVSDPGIALVELFAWMTETLLYRANQIPEKNYIKFLELIGVKLDPSRSARAPVTFYLSGAHTHDLPIAEGTEVATIRTETAPAIVFTTETELTIRPPVPVGFFAQRASLGSEGWVKLEVSRLTDQNVILFPNPPAPGDGFYIALAKDHSHHVLALLAGCKHAGGAGSNPKNPPIVWEAFQGGARWARCELEQDGAEGFNKDGEIVIRVPAMGEEEFANVRGYWLRCRIIEGDMPQYEVSPELERYFRMESRGGTVAARHAITVKDEILGRSDGSPGQMFKLLNGPVLARNPATDYLVVETPDGQAEQWREVPDFAESGANERCFTLDSVDGTLTLGPSLRQPDGAMYHFGAVPAKGSLLRFSRYQYGGGVIGNVSTGAISVMKASIPYVASVRNQEPAIGGLDPQTLDDAKVRAARRLRSHARAVTADDFELHTLQVPGVVRACCLPPGAQPGDKTAIKPGMVFMLVLPEIETPDRPQRSQMVLSEELRRAVLDHLNGRCVLGIGVDVHLPQVTWVSITVELLVAEASSQAVVKELKYRAEEELYRYINPYNGGPDGKGWPFGRDLHLSEIYGLLQRLPSVQYVGAVKIEISEADGRARAAPPRVVIGEHALICSARHVVSVTRSRL